MTQCRCEELSVLWGAVADDYAEAHLVREAVDETTREVVYRCPDTGRRWVLDIADEEPGGAALRLRWLLTTAELVEHLATVHSLEDHMAFWHPEIELQPVGSSDMVRGKEAAREWAERAVADPEFPRTSAISLIDQGEQVLVLGSVSHKRKGLYVEHRPAAWLVTGRNGRIARSLWFDSWDAARMAAGLPAEGAPAAKKLQQRFLFAVRRALRPLVALPKL
jgi:hypothetical protein